MFIISLTYNQPIKAVKTHLENHIDMLFTQAADSAAT